MEESIKMLILCPKYSFYSILCTIRTFTNNLKPSFLPTFKCLSSRTASENLMDGFREKFKKIILASKMSHLLLFGHDKNFLQKLGSVTFMCLLNPNFFMQKSDKNNDTFLRKGHYRQTVRPEFIEPSGRAKVQ